MKVNKLTPLERKMLRLAAELVMAGEWPWEPEKARERKALENAVEKLNDSDSRVPTKEKP